MKQRILQQRLHAQESSCFTYRPAVQARTAPRLLPQRQNHSVSVTFASEASTAASETLMAVPAVKVVGLGLTGLNAILGLLDHPEFRDAEFWLLDTDPKVLAARPQGVQQLAVPGTNQAQLSTQELHCLADRQRSLTTLPSPSQPATAFILGSSVSSPGGAALAPALLTHFRCCGYYTVAALTGPMGWEGARKLAAARDLSRSIEQTAHMAVVVEQGVLAQTSQQLTISEASSIATNSLQNAASSMLTALTAQSCALRLAHGIQHWQGWGTSAVLNPQQCLLDGGSPWALGRGQSSLPLGTPTHPPPLHLLPRMAEDATRAAAQSPFLTTTAGRATRAVCVLNLPHLLLGKPEESQQLGSRAPGRCQWLPGSEVEREAVRTAMLTAAQAVVAMSSGLCQEVLVVVQPLWQHGSSGSAGQTAAGLSPGQAALSVECVLLMTTATGVVPQQQGAASLQGMGHRLAQGWKQRRPLAGARASHAHSPPPAQHESEQLRHRHPLTIHPTPRSWEEGQVQVPHIVPCSSLIAAQAAPGRSLSSRGSTPTRESSRAVGRAVDAETAAAMPPALTTSLTGGSDSCSGMQSGQGRHAGAAGNWTALSMVAGGYAAPSYQTGALQAPPTLALGKVGSSGALDLPPSAAKWRYRLRKASRVQDSCQDEEDGEDWSDDEDMDSGEARQGRSRNGPAGLLWGLLAREATATVTLRSRVAGESSAETSAETAYNAA